MQNNIYYVKMNYLRSESYIYVICLKMNFNIILPKINNSI